MPVGPWPALRALAALGEAIVEVAQAVAWVAVGVLVVVLLVQLVGRRRIQAVSGWLWWWANRRAVRRFGRAVADGELSEAEAHARRLLDPGRCGRPARVRGAARLRGCDLRAVRCQSLPVVAAELAAVGGPGAWCPDLRPVAGRPHTLTVGRARSARLTVRRRADVDGEGGFAVAGSDGSVVTGQLRLRRITGTASDPERVELWVHLEAATGGRRALRCLRVVRRAVRGALRRWARQDPVRSDLRRLVAGRGDDTG